MKAILGANLELMANNKRRENISIVEARMTLKEMAEQLCTNLKEKHEIVMQEPSKYYISRLFIAPNRAVLASCLYKGKFDAKLEKKIKDI